MPPDLKDVHIFMVGIKGTGMTALAELLVARGAIVSGSDTPEVFYTDAILQELGLPVYPRFDAADLSADTELVVYSAAYDPEVHPQLLSAREHSLPLLSYTEALGELSAGVPALGVAGVHGKTTTTAMIGSIALSMRLSGSVVVGSAVGVFDNRSTYSAGDHFLVAETCEYRRHFLSFHPNHLVITGIEPDHLDYFRDYEDILSAFLEYARRLSEGGSLIYCADDSGARDAVARLQAEGASCRLVPYGHSAQGRYRIVKARVSPGTTTFSLAGFETPFEIHQPGMHNVQNAAAAVAAIEALLPGGAAGSREEVAFLHSGLASFTGTRRRSEVIGEAAGVLFIDDYGHHPTAVKKTLHALREYYPGHRLVVDFMSHTYSRTRALLPQFAAAFGDADEVILHKIYASARENFQGEISGEDLAAAVRREHPQVSYFPEVMDAFDYCRRTLGAGDLFVTMGAGNNWVLGQRLFDEFASRAKD